MAMWRPLGLAAFGVIVVGVFVVSAQGPVPGPDTGGLVADVKAMRTEILRAIENNTRAQILIARLASQNARVAAAASRVENADRLLDTITAKRSDAGSAIKRLERRLTGQRGEERDATRDEIADLRSEVKALESQERAADTQLTSAKKALTSEESSRNQLSTQLDELEKALGQKR